MKTPISQKKQRLLVILGPTASGKSDLAVVLAKKYNGEIVSADSRQVYKGLDIGTGKITKREMRGVPHHLLDVASVRRQFSVARFKKLAEKTIADIGRRGKLPILCGGTGFYIQAIVDDLVLPQTKANKALREKLERQSPKQLFALLKKHDPRRAKTIDPKNKRRLIRALEIADELGKSPKLSQKIGRHDVLHIGISLPDSLLREKIHARLIKRLRSGMVAEVRRLKEKNGVSWKRFDDLGLEYRFIAQFLKGELTKQDMTEKLETAIWHYAKRQKTWFKRDKRIEWFDPSKTADIERRVESFLSSPN